MNTPSISPHHSLKNHPLLQYKDLILKCLESEDGHTIPGDTAFQDFKAECESLFHKTGFSHTYFQMQVRLGSTQLANAYEIFLSLEPGLAQKLHALLSQFPIEIKTILAERIWEDTLSYLCLASPYYEATYHQTQIIPHEVTLALPTSCGSGGTLRMNIFRDSDLNRIKEVLNAYKSFKSIVIYPENMYQHKGEEYMRFLISQWKKTKLLWLNFMFFERLSPLALRESSDNMKHLWALTITNSPLTGLSDPTFKLLFDTLPALKSLSLGSTDISNLSHFQVSLFVGIFHQLKHLSLSEMSFGDLGLEKLTTLFSSLGNLVSLSLYEVGLTTLPPDKLKAIFDPLIRLEYLDLEFSGQISPESLSIMFQNTSSLKHLMLDSCDLEDLDDVKADLIFLHLPQIETIHLSQYPKWILERYPHLERKIIYNSQ